MLGLAHTLLAEGLLDEGFLERYCVGFDRFRPYLAGEADGQPKDADWAGHIAGVAPDLIRALARKMASVRTMISASWSIQRADHGEQPYWMLVTLASMLGQIGLPGGGFGFGYGAVNNIGKWIRGFPLPTLPTGSNPTRRTVPVARVTDMLLSPGATFDFNGQKLTYPDIRCIYWCGGNAFHQQQDINRLLGAWRRPETIIVQDSWWTPTARRADIVLPAATTLERNDIAAAPNDRVWFAMQQVCPPLGRARTDFDIYADLAERLGVGAGFTEGRSERDWLSHLYETARATLAKMAIDVPPFATFWETGRLVLPAAQRAPVLMEAYRRDPEKEALKTPSGRIEIFSERIDSFGYADCPGHPVWLEPAEWLGSPLAARYPLHLVSNQPRHRLHSQLDPGSVSRAAKVAGREPVRINPVDAAARGISNGDVVRLFNDRGACLAGAVITDDVLPSVVELSTGAWFDPTDPSAIGSLDKHGNPNMLTRDKGTSRLSQCSTAQTTLVQMERCPHPPPMTAFEPPQRIYADSKR
jgi:biotin/methionine sulfoxide reductase